MEMVVGPKPLGTTDCAAALLSLHGGVGAHGEHSQPVPQQPQHHQPRAPQLPQTQASSSSSSTAASTSNQHTARSASRKRARTDDESPSLPLNSDRCPKSLFCSRRLEMGTICRLLSFYAAIMIFVPFLPSLLLGILCPGENECSDIIFLVGALQLVRVLLESAHALSQKYGGAPVTIVGDFNSTPNSGLYKFLRLCWISLDSRDYL
ncbi:unnamed protein product [Calypogeia fissa]